MKKGQRLGRYEIVDYLGEGGMGIVYRARDAQLGRDVAVKVLNEEAAAKPSRVERFAREARAVARLSHPNILDIHDFGTHGDTTFAVTELLQGQTLGQRLGKGPLPLSTGLKVSRSIAEGLAAAHGEGVIHRDIKPSNIFITDTGQLKILDFGIARLRDKPEDDTRPSTSAPTESVTGSSRMVGTSGYMSPEQIEGGPIDGRSDIFALGCVMYEIFTGRQAFRGKTATDTLLAILGKDPVPIRERRPEVPPAIEAIVKRCLEKQPGERFESARDVAFALQAIGDSRGIGSVDQGEASRPRLFRSRNSRILFGVIAGAAATVTVIFGANEFFVPHVALPPDLHVAVMPLEVVGGGEEWDQFGLGLTDLIASDLTLLERQGYGEFWIVPPGDARYMGAEKIEDMYRVFNVNVVLTGKLQRNGSNIELLLALNDPQRGRVIRTSEVQADVGNVTSLQLDPYRSVIKMLGLELEETDRQWIEGRVTNVAQVFEPYVRARGLLVTGGGEDTTETAISLLQESLEGDPIFDPGRELLAQAYIQRFLETNDPEWFDAAERELQGIIRRKPSHVAYRLLGDLYTANRSLDRADLAFSRALEFDPNDSATLFKLGRVLQRLGRPDDAEQVYQQSISLRPGYWPGHNRLANLYYGQGKYYAAANAWRQAIESAPLCVLGYNNLGALYSWLENYDEARRIFERSLDVDPDNNYAAFSNLGTLDDLDGRFADAVDMYEQALAIEDGDYQVWGNYAYALTFSGKTDEAAEPFGRAIEMAETERSSNPDNHRLMDRLAGYYAVSGRHDESRVVLAELESLQPSDPMVHASMGESYEDLSERETALFWIERALTGGVPPAYLERRPMLRDLVADDRYRQLVAGIAALPAIEGGLTGGDR